MIGPPKWTKTTLCKYSHSLRSVWRPMDMLFAKAICLKTRAALRRGRAATASTAGTAARKTGLVGDSAVSASSVSGGVLWLKIHTFGGRR